MTPFRDHDVDVPTDARQQSEHIHLVRETDDAPRPACGSRRAVASAVEIVPQRLPPGVRRAHRLQPDAADAGMQRQGVGGHGVQRDQRDGDLLLPPNGSPTGRARLGAAGCKAWITSVTCRTMPPSTDTPPLTADRRSPILPRIPSRMPRRRRQYSCHARFLPLIGKRQEFWVARIFFG